MIGSLMPRERTMASLLSFIRPKSCHPFVRLDFGASASKHKVLMPIEESNLIMVSTLAFGFLKPLTNLPQRSTGVSGTLTTTLSMCCLLLSDLTQIQNAKVCICLDRRSYGIGSMLSPELEQWQGPTLLAYNNAVFKEDDFAASRSSNCCHFISHEQALESQPSVNISGKLLASSSGSM